MRSEIDIFLYKKLFLLIIFICAANPFVQNSDLIDRAFAGSPSSDLTSNQGLKKSKFGDWIMACSQLDASKQSQQYCELSQTITVNDQNKPFAKIAIGRVSVDRPIQVTVLVPNNIAFPSSVEIMSYVNEKAGINLNWTRCIPMGCFASATITEELRNRWSLLESQGRVKFLAASGQEILMPISFKGLKEALEALEKMK